MKTGLHLLLFYTAAPILLFSSDAAGALATYYGNGYSPSSEVVSQGTLQMSGDVNSSISVNFTRGGSDSATMGYYLVLFLDSAAGGFSGTGSFSDSSSASRRAISGISGWGSRATATFAGGLFADYAVVINPNVGVELYQLGTAEHTLLGSLAGPTGGSARNYSFTLSRETLGLSGTGTLRFQSTYVGEYGYRTLESFETLAGAAGFNSVSFDFFNFFDVQPVPETTHVALLVFGGLCAGGSLLKKARRRLKILPA